MRFVGLFGTVVSFYLPGDNRNGPFKLHLNPKDVGRAFQICAHHEYRINFPLSSLKTKGKLPPNFYEEVFPSAHTDVGGGYPFIAQYKKTDLPERYDIPTNNTYNRELTRLCFISIRNRNMPAEKDTWTLLNTNLHRNRPITGFTV